MKKIQIISMIAWAMLYCISCEKGDTGPAGSAGQNGSNGQNGNANVQHFEFIVSPVDWQVINTTNWYIDLVIPEITQGIVDSGMVIVYREVSGTNYTLPLTTFSGSTELSFQPSYESGKATINLHSNFAIGSLLAFTFRVMVASSHARIGYVTTQNKNQLEVICVQQSNNK